MRTNFDRRTFLKTTGLAGLAGLTGVGTVAAQGQTRLTWAAGGTGGTYFPLSNEFKTVVEENTDFTLQVQSTGASVENVGSLAQGQADFALIQNDIAFFAYNGTGIEEFQGNAIQGLRGVATLYPETIHVITLQDTGITSFQDLSGATINTGDLGSGTQVDALRILDAAGIQDFNEQNASFAQASDQLKNGDIDAAFIVGGWPVGAVSDLATTNSVVILPIEGDLRQQVEQSSSFFATDTIPAGTYNGVDQPVETVAVQAMIATTTDQSAETVRTITAAIFDNTDQLTIKSDFISQDTALDGMSIPLHPGAREYWNEAGVPIPGNATAGNQTAGNQTVGGNETMGNETAMGNETTAGNSTS